MRRAIRSFLIGIEYGYPLCCIARFCYDVALGLNPAVLRGVIDPHPEELECYDGCGCYVPCGVFHQPTRRFEWRR